MTRDSTLRLRIRPAASIDLPSFDLQGLCACSVLQLTRSDFTIEPTYIGAEPVLYDPEAGSETAGLASILRRYASPPRQADERAYLALALSRLSALVEHSLFSLPQNYVDVTRPALATGLPFPNRFIIPGQLRLRAKERLEREGLWNLGGEVEADEAATRKRKVKGDALDTDLVGRAKAEQAERKERIKREFEKLKIVELAKEILAPFADKLGSQGHFYGDSPSTLDAIVFSHIALLVLLPLPTPIMSTLLESSFPALISHTHRMRDALFQSMPALSSPSTRNWSSLISLPTYSSAPTVRRRVGHTERDDLAKRRWTWIAITGVSLTSFASWQGIVPLPGLQWATSWVIGGDIREEEYY